MQLSNKLIFANQVHREYKNEFKKIGDTVSIRKPVKFYAADGATLVKQDVEEGNTSITVNQRKHVGWEFDSAALTLSIAEYSERYIKPATLVLANVVDQAVAALYSSVWNTVGTVGTTPSTFAHLAAAAQRMDEMAVPSEPRAAVVNGAAKWAIAGAQTALQVQAMAGKAYRTGEIGEVADFTTFGS